MADDRIERIDFHEVREVQEGHEERQELKQLRRIADANERIATASERVANVLERSLFPAAKGLKILQIIGGKMQSDIRGIVKGQSGQFTVEPDPPGSVFPAGVIPVWSEDDTQLSQTTLADGSGNTVASLVSDPATTFKMTVTVGSIVGAVDVPLLPPAPPIATGVNIKQV